MSDKSSDNAGVLRRLYPRDDDSGMALVLVVGSMLILAMLALTTLAFSIQSQRFARYDQDFSGAMAAAQSGIEDYISRLNRNDRYGDSVDCDNDALQGPMEPDTNTCGWTTTTAAGWSSVVGGETDPNAAWFHYSADTSRNSSEGTIILTATGRVNGEYRTIDAAIGKGGSTDYVYYTDFESADPSNVQAYSSTPATECGGDGYEGAEYWYEGRRYENCVEITFISDDYLDGEVFTNDAVLSDGAHFQDGFSSANPGCANVTASSSTWRNCLRQDGENSTADFNGIAPTLAEPLYLDDTSAAFATYPGCHYYGSTRIVFNPSGTMTVWNKRANNGNTAPVSIAAVGLSAPSCGTLDALDSSAGATVAVPDEMVVYVAPAPASVTRQQCDSGQIYPASSADARIPIGTYSRSSIPSPLTGSAPSYSYDTNMVETTKYCAEGNLYAQGVLKGRVTLSAAQSIIVTGDIVLAGGRNGSDMLGLVATNSVEVYHPRKATYRVAKRSPNCGTSTYNQTYQYCTGVNYGDTVSEVPGWPARYTDPTTGTTNPSNGIQIAASIQTLQHSFLVQKYDQGGSQGTLNVFGSIAQRWRGIVGKGSDGYVKLYQYDRRLITASPPYFPRWVNSQWSLRYSGEINTPADVRTS